MPAIRLHAAIPLGAAENTGAKLGPRQDTLTLEFGEQAHQRINADAQVNPPPIASIITKSPRLILPSLHATARASGIDAADVFACKSIVTMTLLGAIPSFSADASIMRRLAWCGTNQSR